MPEQHSISPSNGLMRGLLRSARRRWAVLILGLGLLLVLFVFAGTTRTPGARKNPHTVIASRILAVFGAAMLARIVLLTHEDGVPVLFIAAGADGAVLADSLELIEGRFEIVPLSDVVAFIRDQRYIPRKGVAVVIGADSTEDLAAIKATLGEGEKPGRIPVTLLLGGALTAGAAAGGAVAQFPDGAALGLTIAAGDAGGEAGWDDGRAVDRLKSASSALEAAAGRSVRYAMLEGESGLDLGRIAKAAGLESFFGGDGLNRYGDRGNRIRLMNLARVLAARRARGSRLSAYANMYRGNYLPYPVWLWLDFTAPMPGGGGT